MENTKKGGPAEPVCIHCKGKMWAVAAAPCPSSMDNQHDWTGRWECAHGLDILVCVACRPSRKHSEALAERARAARHEYNRHEHTPWFYVFEWTEARPLKKVDERVADLIAHRLPDGRFEMIKPQNATSWRAPQDAETWRALIRKRAAGRVVIGRVSVLKPRDWICRHCGKQRAAALAGVKCSSAIAHEFDWEEYSMDNTANNPPPTGLFRTKVVTGLEVASMTRKEWDGLDLVGIQFKKSNGIAVVKTRIGESNRILTEKGWDLLVQAHICLAQADMEEVVLGEVK